MLKLCNLLKSTFCITRNSNFERLLPFLRRLYITYLVRSMVCPELYKHLFWQAPVCLEGMGYMLAVWKRARPQMENRLGKVPMMGRIPSCVSLTISLSLTISSYRYYEGIQFIFSGSNMGKFGFPSTMEIITQLAVMKVYFGI